MLLLVTLIIFEVFKIKIIVIGTSNGNYSNDPVKEQIQQIDNLLVGIKKLREEGTLLEMYGVPGLEKMIMIIEAKDIDHVERLFYENFQGPDITYELFYVSDFVNTMEAKKKFLRQ